MHKPITLLFCGNDAQRAAQTAAQLRDGKTLVTMCDASNKDTIYAEPCDTVLIMPDVPAQTREAIKRLYPAAHDVMRQVPTDALRSTLESAKFDSGAMEAKRKRGRPRGKDAN